MYSLFSVRGSFVIAIIVIAVILAFWRPKYGLMAFIVLLFSRDGFLLFWFPDLYKTLHLPLLFGVITVISWILHKGSHPLRFPLQMWLMCFFLMAVLISKIAAQSPLVTGAVAEEFIKMCILFFLIINTITDRRDLMQIIWVVVLINLVLVLYHYYEYKTGWQSIFIFTTFRGLNRNGFAAVLAATAGLTFNMARETGNKVLKAALLFCFLAFVCGVVLTYSRGGALALAVSISLCVLFGKKKKITIPILIILMLIIGSRISGKYFGTLETITGYKEDASAMGRVATNYAAINMLKAHPVSGVGAGNFPGVFFEYTPEDMRQWVEPGKNVHNIVLQVASETGILGLMPFILLVASTFFGIIRSRKRFFGEKGKEEVDYMATGIGIAFFVYFLAMQFGQGAYYGYLYIYVPLAAAALQIKKYQEAEA